MVFWGRRSVTLFESEILLEAKNSIAIEQLLELGIPTKVIAKTTMVDPMDDIARQARQGSVSAIIQVLNDKLADSGVRTRAILAEGVLQLLCEAPTPEQLEQQTLVDRVRQILESLQPRNIRRININSRIVREQQLLWLDEINRDPENQLLWSELITLKRPNPFKRLSDDWRSNKSDATRTALPKGARNDRERRQFWRGIIGGASLSLLLLLVGWVVSDWLGLDPMNSTQEAVQPPSEPPAPVASPVPVAASPSVPASTPAPTGEDPFVQAVRIAEQAAQDGRSAQSAAEWLDIAARWQQASDLMAEVPANDGRYRTAQDRMTVYRQNSESALQQAETRRSPQPTASPGGGNTP